MESNLNYELEHLTTYQRHYDWIGHVIAILHGSENLQMNAGNANRMTAVMSDGAPGWA